jgi:hypothetical protein
VSRLEDVSSALWEDEDFDELRPDAKLTYLWSFTNARCGMCGVYRVRRRSIVEGCLPTKRRDEALKELEEHDYLRYEGGWLWVRSRVKHLRSKGLKTARGVIRDIERVPAEHPLRSAFLTEYLENTWVSSWLSSAEVEGPSMTHRQPIDGLLGKGTGQGKGPGTGGNGAEGAERGKGAKLSKEQLRADWKRWLAHFHETTGRTSIEGSKEAKDAFKARREEGRAVEELMEATAGCHGDERLRANAFDRPETILRASKFERYIQLARQRKSGSNGQPDRSAYEKVEAAE